MLESDHWRRDSKVRTNSQLAFFSNIGIKTTPARYEIVGTLNPPHSRSSAQKNLRSAAARHGIDGGSRALGALAA
jgi:hypothetical protein